MRKPEDDDWLDLTSDPCPPGLAWDHLAVGPARYDEEDAPLDLSSDPCPPGLASDHLQVELHRVDREFELRELQAKTDRDVALLKWGGWLAVLVLIAAGLVACLCLVFGTSPKDVGVVIGCATPLVVGVLAAIGMHWIRKL